MAVSMQLPTKPITECPLSSERIKDTFGLAPGLRRKGGRKGSCLKPSSYLIFSVESPASPIMNISGMSICSR